MTVDHAPRKLRRICWALCVVVVVVFGGVALLLGHAAAGEPAAGPGDRLAFFLIGLLMAAGVLALTRFRVRADETGVWVRNTLGERYFPWGVVAGVDLPDGGTWAQLELQDDDLVAILAIQTSDGTEAVDVLIALRQLLKASRGA